MYVALIGAPLSGKTELAKAIKKEYPGCEIIDRYAEKIGRRCNMAIGPYANYVVNFLIAAERLKLEEEIYRSSDNDGFIVCGTLLETIMYQTLYSSGRWAQTREERQRTNTVVPFFGMLLADMFRFDEAFYLPYEGNNEDSKFYDESIREALQTIPVVHTRLEGGDRAEFAINQLLVSDESVSSSKVDQRGV